MQCRLALSQIWEKYLKRVRIGRSLSRLRGNVVYLWQVEETQDLKGFRKPGPRRFRVKIVRISSGWENLTGIFTDRTKWWVEMESEDLMDSYSQVVLFFVRKMSRVNFVPAWKIIRRMRINKWFGYEVYPMRVAPDGWKGELNLWF